MKPLELQSVRIDKWLWAVRIMKTRQKAADLCKRQKVRVNNLAAKPSCDVKVGAIVTIRQDGIDWQYQVLKCIENRVGAEIAAACKADVTPDAEKAKLEAMKSIWVPRREKGAGRPTKKERRILDRIRPERQL